MMNENIFVEGCRDIKDPAEILNWYRNLYYKEPENSEHRIMAEAINKILPEYCKLVENKKGQSLKREEKDSLKTENTQFSKILRFPISSSDTDVEIKITQQFILGWKYKHCFKRDDTLFVIFEKTEV